MHTLTIHQLLSGSRFSPQAWKLLVEAKRLYTVHLQDLLYYSFNPNATYERSMTILTDAVPTLLTISSVTTNPIRS